MGKKDDYQYDYLDNYVRFADQVNGALFGGRQVVKPDELEPADGTVPDACMICWISMTR